MVIYLEDETGLALQTEVGDYIELESSEVIPPVTKWLVPDRNVEASHFSSYNLVDTAGLTLVDEAGNTIVDTGIDFIPLASSIWTSDNNR